MHTIIAYYFYNRTQNKYLKMFNNKFVPLNRPLWPYTYYIRKWIVMFELCTVSTTHSVIRVAATKYLVLRYLPQQ